MTLLTPLSAVARWLGTNLVARALRQLAGRVSLQLQPAPVPVPVRVDDLW
jgi:hypothetical protein